MGDERDRPLSRGLSRRSCASQLRGETGWEWLSDCHPDWTLPHVRVSCLNRQRQGWIRSWGSSIGHGSKGIRVTRRMKQKKAKSKSPVPRKLCSQPKEREGTKGARKSLVPERLCKSRRCHGSSRATSAQPAWSTAQHAWSAAQRSAERPIPSVNHEIIPFVDFTEVVLSSLLTKNHLSLVYFDLVTKH